MSLPPVGPLGVGPPPVGPPRVSVVVASRGRPGALARCVAALAGQAFQPFEVVAVACAPGLAALAPWGDRLKRVPFEEPNVSRARNLGVAAAAGEVVAFLDDDAVAEPPWLRHLLGAPWEGAAAAAGWVRGPDGLAWAARALRARADGTAEEVPADPVAPTLLRPLRAGPGEGALEAAGMGLGTNMAFRAATLRALGGFDEAFRFFLDESDLFWRLGEAGHAVLTVPLAQVRHGALPSEHRRPDRVARSLHEVGASLAVWARRRNLADPAPLLGAERARRRRTLLRHMVGGRIEPRDVARLLGTLEAGFAEGLARALPPLAALPPGAGPFLPFQATARGAAAPP